MSRIGYARVSTKDQSLDMQLDALKDAGCIKIFSEKISGTRSSRPQFDAMLDYLRDGEDTVVVYKIDRLGRSLKDLVNNMDAFLQRGINVVSIADGIDTSTTMGMTQFKLFAVLADVEHEFIVERTRSGLEAARSRGHFGGRPAVDADAVDMARRMRRDGYSIKEILKATGLSNGSYYKYCRDEVGL